jgi:murein DD-endopeptidase
MTAEKHSSLLHKLLQFLSGRHFPVQHRLLLCFAVALIIGAAVFGTPDSSSAFSTSPEQVTADTLPQADDPVPVTTGSESIPPEPPEPQPWQEKYRIRSGDTLSDIFADKNIPKQVLYQLLQADNEYLALETLHPDTDLTFSFTASGELEKLSLHQDPARQVVFTRQEDGSFSYQLVEAETRWVSRVHQGTISHSFFLSGKQAGLSDRQVEEIAHVLKGKIDFRRDIREGDPFSVLITYERTREQETGHYRIEAVSFTRGRYTYNAFLYTDGNYYDEQGESVLPAFRRWPTPKRYRVSSPFNLSSLHPVTRRVAPHYGVDLATPTGTPVLSIGDGVVTRVGNHPYAGRYVNIRHQGSLSTRYLHLSRVLVKKGERVRRGQKIALSGNTGRTTGPHLHFELRVDGRPVNPLTARIPTAVRIPAKAKAEFDKLVQERLAYLQNPEELNRIYASTELVMAADGGESSGTAIR